jgi:hypothetical protein
MFEEPPMKAMNSERDNKMYSPTFSLLNLNLQK